MPISLPVSIKAVIDVHDLMRDKIEGNETVFVFARAVKGPRQPLAAKRMKVSELPATVVLDDSMAMTPMNKLSDHEQVYIGARITRSGNPIPSSGDLQGRSGVVNTKNQKGIVKIVIDQEIL